MESEVIVKHKNSIVVNWSDENLGFGQLTMSWNSEIKRFVVDSEYLGMENTLKILKSVEL